MLSKGWVKIRCPSFRTHNMARTCCGSCTTTHGICNGLTTQKPFFPQKTSSSNQGLEIDIEPTILRPTTNHGCGSPEAGLSSELHLVMNHAPADHNLVTWVQQLEFGEKSSAPGTDTTRGLSCHSGGEAYGCLPLPEQHRSWKSLLKAAVEVGVTTDAMKF